MIRALKLVLILLLAHEVIGGQKGWYKAHSNLNNTNIHPFAKGIREIKNTEVQYTTEF